MSIIKELILLNIKYLFKVAEYNGPNPSKRSFLQNQIFTKIIVVVTDKMFYVYLNKKNNGLL